MNIYKIFSSWTPPCVSSLLLNDWSFLTDQSRLKYWLIQTLVFVTFLLTSLMSAGVNRERGTCQNHVSHLDVRHQRTPVSSGQSCMWTSDGLNSGISWEENPSRLISGQHGAVSQSSSDSHPQGLGEVERGSVKFGSLVPGDHVTMQNWMWEIREEDIKAPRRRHVLNSRGEDGREQRSAVAS